MAKETISFPGTVDSLEPLRDCVGEKAEKAGLSKKAIFNLKLAIDEIATNIILYGYEAAGLQADIELTSELTDNELIITLSDVAQPFDPLARDLPTDEDLRLSLEERQIGGLGIFLTVNGVDDFAYQYSEGKNINSFTMKLSSGPSGTESGVSQ